MTFRVEKEIVVEADNEGVMETIWTSFPGRYRLLRREHHDSAVLDRLHPCDQLVIPSHGMSNVSIREPKDPTYDRELLWTSTVELQTIYGEKFSHTEERILRMRKGRVSVWQTDANGNCSASTMISEMEMTYAAMRPELDAVEQVHAAWTSSKMPWKTSQGDNYLSIEFFIGHLRHFRMDHLIDMEDGRRSSQSDKYFYLKEQPGGCGDDLPPIPPAVTAKENSCHQIQV